jgi:hypothetical protein
MLVAATPKYQYVARFHSSFVKNSENLNAKKSPDEIAKNRIMRRRDAYVLIPKNLRTIEKIGTISQL